MKTSIVLAAAVAAAVTALPAQARETIKLGLSVPNSGSAAAWGKAGEWLCKKAAEEVAAAGGVKVGDKVYDFDCIAYDNKYNAAEGAKVAQTLLNRDGVKFISLSIGTAPVRALQSLSERSGVLLFTTGWGRSIKGPNFPLTFTQMNTPGELFKPLLSYVKQQHPGIKTVAMLNPNDATGQDAAPVGEESWTALGVKVLSKDWYERGTTEFQPIAAKIAGLKPDAVDFGTTVPGDAGAIFRELKVLGWKGVQVLGVGTGTDGLVTTGAEAANGTYLGAAIPLDGKLATDKQKALNAAARAVSGEHLNGITLGSYDAVFALKAAMEKAQSIDPKAVAAALPTITFESFYGPSGFGGKDVYGTPQQQLIPVIVTQIQDGKLVELQRIDSEEMRKRLTK